MKESVVRRNTCCLCGKNDLELVFPLEPTPPGDHYISHEQLDKIQETYPLNIALCTSCGHTQLLDVVNPNILYHDYIYETSISLGLSEHFERYADEVMKNVNPAKGSLVVDIGSNDGTLLKFFQKHGMNVLGIDPAHEIAKKATDAGIETLPTYFTTELARKIKKKHGPASIITANNVIANIDNLKDMIVGIKKLLAPDGVFVFETGYLVDLIENSLIDNIYHEHLFYYAVKPLKKFFQSHNVELIDVKRVPTKGGSIRGTVQLANGPHKVSSSVNELISLEERLKLDNSEGIRNFATKMDGVKDELVDMLNDLKSQRKTIAGYGASVGVTTLLYQFDLGGLLNFIVDDNKSKHNLYSPGFHIPIFSSDVLYEKKPDLSLIHI